MLIRSLARLAAPSLVALALAACGGPATSTGSSGAAATAPGAAATSPAAVPTSAGATAGTSAAASPTSGAASAAGSATVAPTPGAAAGATPAIGATTSTAGGAVSFKADVQPIFAASCTGCHGGAAGLTLGSYADVMKGGKDGAVVKPGDADNSLLVQKVKGTQTIGARMPRGGSPLPDAQIQKISDWVAQGAKDN